VAQKNIFNDICELLSRLLLVGCACQEDTGDRNHLKYFDWHCLLGSRLRQVTSMEGMSADTESAPPSCGCGHIFAVDNANRHANTIEQHRKHSKKHSEWEKQGFPIPILPCSCGETFDRAPSEQHERIISRHKAGNKHTQWVHNGAIPVTSAKKQTQISFGRVLAAPSPGPIHHPSTDMAALPDRACPAHANVSEALPQIELMPTVVGIDERNLTVSAVATTNIPHLHSAATLLEDNGSLFLQHHEQPVLLAPTYSCLASIYQLLTQLLLLLSTIVCCVRYVEAAMNGPPSSRTWEQKSLSLSSILMETLSARSIAVFAVQILHVQSLLNELLNAPVWGRHVPLKPINFDK